MNGTLSRFDDGATSSFMQRQIQSSNKTALSTPPRWNFSHIPAQSNTQPHVQLKPMSRSRNDQVKDKIEEQPTPNLTGLPNTLKSGVESLSGISMDHVTVHYNSPQPAQLQAKAYAQGNDIHIGPGQEKHLPHEAWHVVQQMQGRVRPTIQMKGDVTINDDPGLEAEAEIMGMQAATTFQTPTLPLQKKPQPGEEAPVQGVFEEIWELVIQYAIPITWDLLTVVATLVATYGLEQVVNFIERCIRGRQNVSQELTAVSKGEKSIETTDSSGSPATTNSDHEPKVKETTSSSKQSKEETT